MEMNSLAGSGGVNPWKIIGWIVLVGLVLMLAMCGLVLVGSGNAAADREASPPARAATPPAVPQYAVTVVSVECVGRQGSQRADVTVRNISSVPIPFAKAFAVFKDKAGAVISANDSYFSPSTIPPGSTASADVYSSGGAAHSCMLSGIQDGQGMQVQLR